METRTQSDLSQSDKLNCSLQEINLNRKGRGREEEANIKIRGSDLLKFVVHLYFALN